MNPSSNCHTQTVVIKVGAASLTVEPEALTVTPSTSTQTIPSIFDNDSIGGVVTPTAGPSGNVTMTVTNPSGSNVPTMDPNTGIITVPGNTPAGSYTITYNYCEVLNPSNCTGVRTAVVTVGAASLTVASDTFTVGNGIATQTAGNILTNDSLGGNTPTAGPTGSVTLTVTTPATSINGGKVPTLNVNTGDVVVPAGTPSGTYTITYKECESLNPSSNCKTETVVVKVGSASLTVTPDSPTVTPSTSTQTTPSVLDNDSIGGVVTPTAGPGGNVTMTVTNPSGTTVPNMNPNTGVITIPGNTPAGNYTITYSYCEVLNPSNCTGVQSVVVTVVPAPTVVTTPDSFTRTGTATVTTPSVLTNDRIVNPDGSTTTPVIGTNVTITNVVVTPSPAPGQPTPTLNPDGTVTVPGNLAPGNYTITYDVCILPTGTTSCTTGVMTVTVLQPAPVVRPDSFVVTGTSTQTTPSIFDNDDFVNPDGSVSSVTTGTLTITNVVVSPILPGNPTPVINPDGTITIPDGIAPDNYTITYDVCTTATPVNCTSGVVTMTIRPTQPTVVTTPDSFTRTGTATVTTPSVLTNDRIVNPDGSTTTPVIGTNVTITNVVVTPSPAPGQPTPTLNPDGTVTVPGNLAPGNYTITYDVCILPTGTTSCTTGVMTVTVLQPAPVVRPDSFVVTGTSTQTTPSIFDNDDFVNPDGSVSSVTTGTLTITNVVVSPIVPGNPTPVINPDGTITIPNGMTPGNYTITYDVCTTATPTNCTTGVVTMTIRPIQPTVVTTPDSFTRTGTATVTTPSVLTNDHIVNPDGSTTTPVIGTNVTITNVVVTPSPAPGQPTPTLNPDGTVTVPGNLAPGNYTITYDVCSLPIGITSCTTGVMTVTVLQPAPVVRPDSFVVTGTSTQTTPSIFDNDDFVNPDGSVSSVTTGTLTITNVVVSPIVPGNPTPVINPDGTITIPNGMTPGNYTITYDVCTTATPTNCTTGVVTMTIMPTVVPVAVDDLAATAKDTPVTISVLANDTLNGAVTPTIVTHPTNGTTVENTDGTIEYRPYTGFVGTDSFVYEICNGAGCSSATVTVKITGDIIVYNGVSLNGNDKNNHFHIGGIENYPNNKVRIYNRWGVEVFSVEGYDNVTKVFKGISDGRVTIEASERLPQGTYYYIIEYVDEHNKKQTEVGWLYLKKN